MVKVLIADDEKRVCRLICDIIDWKGLGFEIIATVNDGISAMEYMEKEKPDLVITDIRMPGYNGIELIQRIKESAPDTHIIIVSGYKHFDYAHNAIKYGVEDYLLKPLKKDELLMVLKKMMARRNKALNTEQAMCTMTARLRVDSEKIREIMMRSILLPLPETVYSEKESAGQEFYRYFAEGCFRGIVVKPDLSRDGEEDDTNAYLLLMKKASVIVERELREVFSDVAVNIARDGIVCLVNGEMDESALAGVLRQMRKKLRNLNDIFPDAYAVVGVGPAVSANIEAARNSVEEAKRAALHRLIEDTESIFYSKEIRKAQIAVQDIITPETRDQLVSTVEFFDSEMLTAMLDCLEISFQERKDEIDGNLARDFCFELFADFAHSSKNLGHEIPEKAVNSFRNGFYRCGTGKMMFAFLRSTFRTFLDGWLQEQKNMNSKPIRIAKQYIRDNFNKTVTLDEMGSLVGFSAAYFSNLFKAETGRNFKQYLAEIRVEEAKRLFRESHGSIGNVAEEVGYNDIKHFTKLFKKHTGLSPAEYKKLYS